MIRTFLSSAIIIFSLAAPSRAAAQARVVGVFPDGARVAVVRLGATGGEFARVGAPDLLPGDMLLAGDSAFVELRCPVDGADSYRLNGPFRVVIDVPGAAACPLNLLSGEVSVIAENPTEQTVGTVTLGSTGTQYAITVRRDSTGTSPRIIVFDGTVRMRTPSYRLTVPPGRNTTYNPRVPEPAVRENTTAQVERWAGLYARFDLFAMRRDTAAAPADTAEVLAQLTSLHYAVLERPADPERRVALARAQLDHGASSQAVYNLKRAGVTRDTSLLRRYRIDPAVLRRVTRDTSLMRRYRLDPAMLRRVIPDTSAAGRYRLDPNARRRVIPDTSASPRATGLGPDTSRESPHR